MKVVVDTNKIGELVYEWLIEYYSFTKARATLISDTVEEFLIENDNQ